MLFYTVCHWCVITSNAYNVVNSMNRKAVAEVVKMIGF